MLKLQNIDNYQHFLFQFFQFFKKFQFLLVQKHSNCKTLENYLFLFLLKHSTYETLKNLTFASLKHSKFRTSSFQPNLACFSEFCLNLILLFEIKTTFKLKQKIQLKQVQFTRQIKVYTLDLLLWRCFLFKKYSQFTMFFLLKFNRYLNVFSLFMGQNCFKFSLFSSSSKQTVKLQWIMSQIGQRQTKLQMLHRKGGWKTLINGQLMLTLWTMRNERKKSYCRKIMSPKIEISYPIELDPIAHSLSFIYMTRKAFEKRLGKLIEWNFG